MHYLDYDNCYVYALARPVAVPSTDQLCLHLLGMPPIEDSQGEGTSRSSGCQACRGWLGGDRD